MHFFFRFFKALGCSVSSFYIEVLRPNTVLKLKQAIVNVLMKIKYINTHENRQMDGKDQRSVNN